MRGVLVGKKGLLGGFSAESLICTICFIKGKLFGLRAGEHRLLRLRSSFVKENYIIFDDVCLKRFTAARKI